MDDCLSNYFTATLKGNCASRDGGKHCCRISAFLIKTKASQTCTRVHFLIVFLLLALVVVTVVSGLDELKLNWTTYIFAPQSAMKWSHLENRHLQTCSTVLFHNKHKITKLLICPWIFSNLYMCVTLSLNPNCQSLQKTCKCLIFQNDWAIS